MNKILNVFFVIVIVFALGCKNDNSNQSQNNSSDSLNHSQITVSNSDVSSITYDFEELTFNSSEIPSNLYVGDITTGKKWQDKAGINYFIVSEKITTQRSNDGPDIKSYEIHGYHFVENNGNFNLIREIQDFQTECDLILDCGFSDNSLELTDINDDNYGEISFLYHLYCAMDASPSTLKLMLLENGEKYPIRGNTYLFMPPSYFMGGETNIDPSFDNAPPGFKDFALQKWTKFQNIESGIIEGVELLAPFENVVFNGTEPFWDVKFDKFNAAITENIGEQTRFFKYTSIGQTSDGIIHITAKEGNVYYDFNIVQETCSDGMSDFEYTYSI